MALDALILQAQQGDTQAFDRLVRAHQAQVRQQLRRLTRGDAALADDLAQDTFVTAWQRLPDFRGEASLRTWLHRLAHQRFLTHLRESQALKRGGAQAPVHELDAGADQAHDGGQQAHQALWRIDLEAALATLSPAQQHSVLYAWVLGWSHDEVAEVLGMPLGTVKSHIARARTHLQQHLLAFQGVET